VKTLIVYGSTTGVTKSIAESIGSKFDGAVLKDVSDSGCFSDFGAYELVILGTSTWGIGDLQDDWLDKVNELDGLDFSGKCVALFGTGDQTGYPDSFISSVKEIYTKVEKQGAKIIGFTSTEGYSYDDSDAVVDDKFICLAIDDDNQSDKTDGRIDAWVKQVNEEAAS